jgi:hypothetical protein
VVPPDRVAASLRRPQPLLLTSEPLGFAGRFRTSFNSAPVGNGGLPATANRFLSPRRLAGAIRIALAVPVLTVPGSLSDPRDLLVPARTTLAAS